MQKRVWDVVLRKQRRVKWKNQRYLYDKQISNERDFSKNIENLIFDLIKNLNFHTEEDLKNEGIEKLLKKVKMKIQELSKFKEEFLLSKQKQ